MPKFCGWLFSRDMDRSQRARARRRCQMSLENPKIEATWSITLPRCAYMDRRGVYQKEIYRCCGFQEPAWLCCTLAGHEEVYSTYSASSSFLGLLIYQEGYDMPPIVRYGLDSYSGDTSWMCKCRRRNQHIRGLLFMVPKFYCDNCGKKFNKNFRVSYDDARVNGHRILGKVHIQKRGRCVAYANLHALQVLERWEAIQMKQDPDLLEDLDAEELFDGFKRRRAVMITKGYPTKRRRNVRNVHIPFLLKEVGLRGQSAEPKVHKVADVTVIPRDDFVGITTAIADGAALVSSFHSGKRLGRLKYGQIYRAYRASKYSKQTKKISGHAVCLIGAGREKGEEYYDFVNSHKDFCVRRDSNGNILRSGVGRIRASDLKSNVIRLSATVIDGQDEWRLKPQRKVELNQHNRELMCRLKEP